MKSKDKHTKGEARNAQVSGEANYTSATENSRATESAEAAGSGQDSANESDAGEKSDLLTLKAELAQMQEKYLRSVAEFDNYRKRTLREKMELSKLAGQEILSGFLPVVDDIDRAIAIMDHATDLEAMKEGILLINNKLKDFLMQKGVKEIEAINTEFNTDTHEAITKIAVEDEAQKGKVVDVIQKGYYLHDKVMRYAKVVVGY